MKTEMVLLATAAVIVALVLRNKLRLPSREDIERDSPMQGLAPAAVRELREAAVALVRSRIAKSMCCPVPFSELAEAALPDRLDSDQLADLEAWAECVCGEPALRLACPELVERLCIAVAATTGSRYRELEERCEREAKRRLAVYVSGVEARGDIDEPAGGAL